MRYSKKLFSVLIMMMFSVAVIAADKIKPYVLASNEAGDFTEVVAKVKASVVEAGFTIVGNYQPYDGADIQIITSDALKEAAAKSENGGFGSVIRVSTTQVEENIQVSYVNPAYMSAMYRMKSDLSEVSDALEEHLGAETAFGSEKGMTKKKANKYHYWSFMPYFDDVDKLASFSSYDDAVAGVEQALSEGVAGVGKVYQVDIPGSEITLFGVSFSEGKAEDERVMSIIDKSEIKHTAHLPYEMMVNGKNVISLRGKFRLAQSFPDLPMGKFMKIQNVPGAITKSLEKVAEANQ